MLFLKSWEIISWSQCKYKWQTTLSQTRQWFDMTHQYPTQGWTERVPVRPDSGLIWAINTLLGDGPESVPVSPIVFGYEPSSDPRRYQSDLTVVLYKPSIPYSKMALRAYQSDPTMVWNEPSIPYPGGDLRGYQSGLTRVWRGSIILVQRTLKYRLSDCCLGINIVMSFCQLQWAHQWSNLIFCLSLVTVCTYMFDKHIKSWCHTTRHWRHIAIHEVISLRLSDVI